MMTPEERNLLVVMARAVWTRIISDGIRKDLADAIWQVENQGKTSFTCDVVGYPQGEKKICELPRDHAEEYHRAGSVQWIGYYQTPLTEHKV
jgi:hypothetical protein